MPVLSLGSTVEQTTGQDRPEFARRQQAGLEILRRRAAFLPPRQRALIDLTIQGKLTRRDIGRLLGIPAGTVTRRVQRLAARLYDPLVVALIERPGELREEYRQVGIEFFLHKLNASQLADLHQLSRDQVKQMIEFVKGWFRGVSQKGGG